MTAPLVRLDRITKRFGAKLANDRVSLELAPGEVHALLGENGAGKTTLVNVLFGKFRPDSGELHWKGRPVQLRSSRDALALGMGMVHQHFKLVPTFTAAENLMLGQRQPLEPLLDVRGAEARLAELSERHGLPVDARTPVRELPLGLQHRVEILKALDHAVDLLVLDEPTAVLTPEEARTLFRALAGLAAQGTAILLITHKLEEVLHVAGNFTVLRQGRVAGTGAVAGTTRDELARLMVGRDVPTARRAPAAHAAGQPVLELEQVCARADRAIAALSDITLAVRAGEIVGIAGVEGNGQRELAEVVTGLRRVTAGVVRLLGADIAGRSAREILDSGVGHVPEDRQRSGLVLDLPLETNLVLDRVHRAPLSRLGVLFPARVRALAERLLAEHDVRGGAPADPARRLSGGNQQKVVLARELDRAVKLLVAVHPTRGLDVGAIEQVHRRLREARDGGAGVLLISAELDEVLALADRVLVLHGGRVVGAVDGASADREQVGLWMAGVA